MTAEPIPYTLEELPLAGPSFEAAIGVYSAAFREPPYEDKTRGREVRSRLKGPHATRPGFRGLIARERDEGDVVGLAYGYRSGPGQWWYDHVRPEVSARLGPSEAAYWFNDAYELVEVAVHPEHQGRGLGRSLIIELMAGRPERTSLLSTRTDSRAHILYRRLGYRPLTEIRFWSGDALYYVMGVDLPLEENPPPGNESSRATINPR